MTTARGLITAVSWLSLGNIISRALALITMPLLTRWLSPEAYGGAALVGTMVSLASVFALAGIDMSYSRHYFSGAVGDSQSVESFCWRWALGMSLLFGIIGGVFWAVGFSQWFDADASLTGFVTIGIATSTLATMAQARARLQNRYARISQIQFITGLSAAAISLGVAYWWRQDAWPLLLAMVAGYSLPVLLLGMPSPARLARPSGLSRSAAGGLLRVGLAGVVTAPAYWIVSSSDRWFLAHYFDSAVVGIYSTGYTVGTVGIVVSTAITSAWLPELSRAEVTFDASLAQKKGELSQLLVAAMLVVWLAVVAAGGDVIRLLADVRFHQATAVVPWLAAGVLFYGVMHVGNTHLILLGKLHWAGWIWGLALVVSLALNVLLVPRYGSLGAAFTQGVTFLLAMLLIWAAVLRFESIPIQWFRLALAITFSALAGFTMFQPWSDMPLLSLGYKLPVGMILALICFLLLSPDFLWRVMKKVSQ